MKKPEKQLYSVCGTTVQRFDILLEARTDKRAIKFTKYLFKEDAIDLGKNELRIKIKRIPKKKADHIYRGRYIDEQYNL